MRAYVFSDLRAGTRIITPVPKCIAQEDCKVYSVNRRSRLSPETFDPTLCGHFGCLQRRLKA